MQYQRVGDRYIVRFESGERVLEPLLAWLEAHKIGYAAMSGLGALRHATVSYWNSGSQLYEAHEIDEQVEVVSLVGNATLKEGAPLVHAHVALGRADLSLIGGHFNEGVVHPNLEIWLRPEAEAVHRTLDASCGLFLMHLPERL